MSYSGKVRRGRSRKRLRRLSILAAALIAGVLALGGVYSCLKKSRQAALVGETAPGKRCLPVAERLSKHGDTLLRGGYLTEAVRAYDRALDLEPENARTWCKLAQALRRQERYREALLAMERADELGSRDPQWSFPSGAWVNELRALAEVEVARVLR